MTGSTQEDYAKMMLAGGRSVEGNRSKSGKAKPAKSEIQVETQIQVVSKAEVSRG